jgi:putative ABC transport system permease protein
VSGLVVLLSKTYLKLVLLANLIAWPIAYLMMRRWLSDFVYRIELSFGVFILSMVTATVISLLTVSFHSIRAAGSDPVKALRYE